MLYPKHVEAQSGRLKEQPARPAHWKRTADPVSTESGVHSANTASFALWRAEGGCRGLMHPGRDPAKLDGSGNIIGWIFRARRFGVPSTFSPEVPAVTMHGHLTLFRLSLQRRLPP